MMVTVKEVSLIYRSRNAVLQAINNVSLDIGKGETCVLIGPSGCGKSSLLFLVAGLIEPTQGMIRINGQLISRPRKRTALILQDHGLFPWKTVRENIELGLKIRKVSSAKIKQVVEPIIDQLGLRDYLQHYPTQISGGQRQRVAIGRALALEPDLLLMDEPFSSLDALTREELQRLLLDLWKQRQVTIVLVTHNIEEAVFLGRKIVVLSQRPARILKIIENPLIEVEDYRLSPEFYQRCSDIRKMLEANHREKQ